MSHDAISRYQIIDEIGRGGMATVYRAYDPRFKRDVAVKIMAGEYLQDPLLRARFEREAQTIAVLEHPAIVPVYDFGEDEGRLFLVMRIMTGGTLSDRLRRGPLPVSETTAILRRIGGALERAHSKGVVHRDLKPSNILFDSYGDAFLADFGIARLAESTVTLTGQAVIGTPAYMSPEQIHGDKSIDGRSDIYALGVICFEMLTGQRPYWDETPAKVMMKHIIDPVPEICQVNPDLPVGVNDIISRTMAKEPDDRFSTASEMTDMLEAAIQPLSPAATSPEPAQIEEQMVSTEQKESPDLAEVVIATPHAESPLIPVPDTQEVTPATEVKPPDFVYGPPASDDAPPDLQPAPVPAIAADQPDRVQEQVPATETATPESTPAADEPARYSLRFPLIIAGILILVCVILAGITIVATGVLSPDEDQDAQPEEPVLGGGEAEVGDNQSDEMELAVTEEDPVASEPPTAEFVDTFANAERHMEEARKLLEEGDLDGALLQVSVAIESVPDLARPYFQRSELLRMMGEYDQAVSDVSRAIDIEPSAENFAQRASIHFEQDNLELAIEDLHRAIEHDPDDSTLYTELATLYGHIEDYGPSLDLLDKALEIDPTNSQALSARSHIYRELDDPDAALDDALRAYELTPEELWLLDTIAAIYAWDLDDWESGVVYYGMAIAQEPEEGWRYADRAVLFRFLGQGESAIVDHDKAIELEPDDTWYLIDKAITLVELFEDFDGAMGLFELAIEIDPGDPDPFEERARLYADYLGDYEAALGDLNQAIERDPEAAWRYGVRAALHQEMGNSDEALADFVRATELDTADAWSFIDLGYFLFEEKNEPEAALDAWNRAVELEPGNPNAYQARFQYFALVTGDNDAAIADLSSCLDIDPESAWCYWERAWLFDTIGDTRLALEDMRMFLELTDPEDCPDCLDEASRYIEANS